MKVKLNVNVKHDGKDYKEGDVIHDISDADARALIARGDAKPPINQQNQEQTPEQRAEAEQRQAEEDARKAQEAQNGQGGGQQ